jgi:hypothetical protein
MPVHAAIRSKHRPENRNPVTLVRVQGNLMSPVTWPDIRADNWTAGLSPGRNNQDRKKDGGRDDGHRERQIRPDR